MFLSQQKNSQIALIKMDVDSALLWLWYYALKFQTFAVINQFDDSEKD